MDYKPQAEKIAIYYRQLRDYSIKTIKTTADQLAMSSDRFPTLETWRAMCWKHDHPAGQNEDVLDPPTPKELAIGSVMLPYLSGKITGDEAFNQLSTVYQEHGGDMLPSFAKLKGQGRFRVFREMPQGEEKDEI